MLGPARRVPLAAAPTKSASAGEKHRPSPPRRRKPEWNDTKRDLSVYKLSPEEIRRRKERVQSAHIEEAREELADKLEALADGSGTDAVLAALHAEGYDSADEFRSAHGRARPGLPGGGGAERGVGGEGAAEHVEEHSWLREHAARAADAGVSGWDGDEAASPARALGGGGLPVVGAVDAPPSKMADGHRPHTASADGAAISWTPAAATDDAPHAAAYGTPPAERARSSRRSGSSARRGGGSGGAAAAAAAASPRPPDKLGLSRIEHACSSLAAQVRAYEGSTGRTGAASSRSAGGARSARGAGGAARSAGATPASGGGGGGGGGGGSGYSGYSDMLVELTAKLVSYLNDAEGRLRESEKARKTTAADFERRLSAAEASGRAATEALRAVEQELGVTKREHAATLETLVNKVAVLEQASVHAHVTGLFAALQGEAPRAPPADFGPADLAPPPPPRSPRSAPHPFDGRALGRGAAASPSAHAQHWPLGVSSAVGPGLYSPAASVGTAPGGRPASAAARVYSSPAPPPPPPPLAAAAVAAAARARPPAAAGGGRGDGGAALPPAPYATAATPPPPPAVRLPTVAACRASPPPPAPAWASPPPAEIAISAGGGGEIAISAGSQASPAQPAGSAAQQGAPYDAHGYHAPAPYAPTPPAAARASVAQRQSQSQPQPPQPQPQPQQPQQPQQQPPQQPHAPAGSEGAHAESAAPYAAYARAAGGWVPPPPPPLPPAEPSAAGAHAASAAEIAISEQLISFSPPPPPRSLTQELFGAEIAISEPAPPGAGSCSFAHAEREASMTPHSEAAEPRVVVASATTTAAGSPAGARAIAEPAGAGAHGAPRAPLPMSALLQAQAVVETREAVRAAAGAAARAKPRHVAAGGGGGGAGRGAHSPTAKRAGRGARSPGGARSGGGGALASLRDTNTQPGAAEGAAAAGSPYTLPLGRSLARRP